MPSLPESVNLTEVGPRDGFQFETKIIPTDLKVEIIERLVDAGLKYIQVASFVHPKIVPQMADAEKVITRLVSRNGVIFSALALNLKGVERADKAGITNIEISASASDTHSRKNAGMSLEQAVKSGKEMIKQAKSYGMQVIASIQCSFGCVQEGYIPHERILNIAKDFMAQGIDRLSLADTTGMANPISVKSLLEIILSEIKNTPVSLHLHDTKGLGLVNLMAAMEMGIRHFDTSLAGMGGCPFVAGAAGNIATEDTVHLMESMNIKTGINIEKVAQCSLILESFLKKSFAGKIYRLKKLEIC